MHEHNQYALKIELCGSVKFHLFVHVDHSAIAAKLHAETDKLRAAVDAAKQSPPEPAH